MFRTNHARRSLVAGAAFAALSLGAVAAAPGALAAPGDSAGPTPSVGPTQTGGHTKLSVTGPAAVGLAGKPVEFTEKIINTNAEPEDLLLDLLVDAGGIPDNGLSLEYRTDSGVWKPLSLDIHAGTFEASLPGTIKLGPNETRTFHLRLGLPMGEPHNGDSNGGATSLKLTSSVGAADGSWTLQARDIRTVKVQGLTSTLTGVPATAVPGGAPIEFKATAANTTASDYVNVTTVLYTNRYATVQVYRGGHWVTLAPVLPNDGPDVAGYYLRARDYSAAKGSSSTVRVRISYKKTAPLGNTTVQQSIIVNEGSTAFHGSYVG
ncbi:MAG: hypothetical protein QOF98_3234, partial [Streptomyces sp.]|nr:hypothetical protein [Streptomyces sp.]